MMPRSLFWKICAIFMAVVALSALVGNKVFNVAMHYMYSHDHRGFHQCFYRAIFYPIEQMVAKGGTGPEIDTYIAQWLKDFPHSTVLVAQKGWGVHGRVEAGHEDIKRYLLDLVDQDGVEASPRLVFSGLGRGVFTIIPLRLNGRPACGLVANRGREDHTAVALQAGALAVAASVLVAIALGLLVFRVLSRRLSQLKDALGAVADGDLGRRVHDPAPDEIGDIGRSFNRMAERLSLVVGELEAIDRKRRQFLADISHELKTPVTAMRVQLEPVVRDGVSAIPDRSDKAVLIAFEETERMSLLIEDLLELARLESTEFRLKLEEHVVQRIAARSMERLVVAMNNRKIRTSTNLWPEPLRRKVDARRLEQVVTNLVQNAIQSMPDGGQIDLTVEEVGERVRLVVSDSGPGIPEEERTKVFDRFYTGSETYGGTGLGLSIVKRLVTAHGGQVWFEDRPGGGTRAIIEL